MLREGQNGGEGSGANRARFVSKIGLDIQLDIQLGVLRHIGTHPHRDKNGGRNGDF